MSALSKRVGDAVFRARQKLQGRIPEALLSDLLVKWERLVNISYEAEAQKRTLDLEITQQIMQLISELEKLVNAVDAFEQQLMVAANVSEEASVASGPGKVSL